MPPIKPVKRTSSIKKSASSSRANNLIGVAIFLIALVGVLATVVVRYRPHEVLSLGAYRIMGTLASRLGLVLKTIEIQGNSRVKKVEILATLGLSPDTPLHDIDPNLVTKKLHNIVWIKESWVRRSWPQTLSITIVERQPFALWQINKNIHLVDKEGVVIPTPMIQEFYKLPHIIGVDAPQNAAALLSTLCKYPTLQEHITAHIFMDKRRWDFIYKKKIRIKLPAENLEAALEHLEKLEKKGHIHNDNVISIDVRIPNRTYFELSPKALTQQMKLAAVSR